jgi:hypothetical protein
MGPVQVARQPTDQGAVGTAPVSRHGGPDGGIVRVEVGRVGTARSISITTVTGPSGR